MTMQQIKTKYGLALEDLDPASQVGALLRTHYVITDDATRSFVLAVEGEAVDRVTQAMSPQTPTPADFIAFVGSEGKPELRHELARFFGGPPTKRTTDDSDTREHRLSKPTVRYKPPDPREKLTWPGRRRQTKAQSKAKAQLKKLKRRKKTGNVVSGESVTTPSFVAGDLVVALYPDGRKRSYYCRIKMILTEDCSIDGDGSFRGYKVQFFDGQELDFDHGKIASVPTVGDAVFTTYPSNGGNGKEMFYKATIIATNYTSSPPTIDTRSHGDNIEKMNVELKHDIVQIGKKW